jgi:azurin
VTELTIQPVGNQMKYEQTEFTVPAGEEITITFENTATSPAMEHNVVVLTSDDDTVVNRVGQAAMGAADSEYVPDDEAILAATDMAAPGETVSVTFTAPSEPGTYRYICTFPGHYTVMQGTMTVVAS